MLTYGNKSIWLRLLRKLTVRKGYLLIGTDDLTKRKMYYFTL